MAQSKKLDGHHVATVEKIFRHPTSHNIQWHDVLSLLQAVAEIKRESDSRVTMSLGSETVTFEVPRGHDVDEQMVVDLRRLLKGAGITPESV